MEINFERDMKIDEQSLDVEWLKQTELAHLYNQHYAQCYKDLQIAQEEVKTIRSSLIRKANKFPEIHCLKPKPTAGDIEAYYRTHPKYKRLKTKVIDLEYEKNMAELGKNEINYTRKAALEQLVTLLGQSYFAGPRAPRNLTKERKKAEKERQQRNLTRIGKKMSKIKKRRK